MNGRGDQHLVPGSAAALNSRGARWALSLNTFAGGVDDDGDCWRPIRTAIAERPIAGVSSVNFPQRLLDPEGSPGRHVQGHSSEPADTSDSHQPITKPLQHVAAEPGRPPRFDAASK